MKYFKKLLRKWKLRRWKKSVCKSMNYFCPDCIYHDHHFEGVIYRGTSCRLEGIK